MGYKINHVIKIALRQSAAVMCGVGHFEILSLQAYKRTAEFIDGDKVRLEQAYYIKYETIIKGKVK